MKSVADRSNVPPVATTTEAKEGTILKVPSKKISVSEEALTFLDPQVSRQPCLSRLPAVQGKVSGIIDADQVQKEATNDKVLIPSIGGAVIKMSPEDQRFWRTVCIKCRMEAKYYLNILIKNDDGINLDDRRKLADSLNIIDRAGLA